MALVEVPGRSAADGMRAPSCGQRPGNSRAGTRQLCVVGAERVAAGKTASGGSPKVSR